MTRRRSMAVILGLLAVSLPAAAQTVPLLADQGAAAAWERLLDLRTIASVLHTTAHPDDEHGGTLARLGRGLGVRVAMLTLTRGEAGDNALGPELFDALGLIRTEELRQANRYYGVDEQYFSSAVDYGYSKRLDEALEKWGREAVLADIVRVIRITRPLVVVSRFQGSPRDGHGQHQAAGLLTREAYLAAGDPARFPDHLQAGLRPWQPLKLYVGGARADERWTVAIDASAYGPWLGASFAAVARTGLSFQRSQNAGRPSAGTGPAVYRYRRVASQVAAPARESSLFDGIDTTIEGVADLWTQPAAPQARRWLAAIDAAVATATARFSIAQPSAAVPALIQGLEATRTALARLDDPESQFILGHKTRQFEAAIAAALGLRLTAVAAPVEGTAGGGASAPVMGPLVAGQSLVVETRLTAPTPAELTLLRIDLDTPPGWEIAAPAVEPVALGPQAAVTRRFRLRVPDGATPSRPYFERDSLAENHYRVVDPSVRHRAAAPPLVRARAAIQVGGRVITLATAAERREAHLPYGYEMRALQVVPGLAVHVQPRLAIVSTTDSAPTLTLTAEVVNNWDAQARGVLELDLPAGWRSQPASSRFALAERGARAVVRFEVSGETPHAGEGRIGVVARAGGREFRAGYEELAYPDLETRYLYRPAEARVRAVDVRIVPDLSVGYVMGIGDRIPEAIAQLGARVQLLAAEDLASGDLDQFDTIVLGTRAYAVRRDLHTYNHRLLDFADRGGHLLVLYNTAEFVPRVHAPFPATLPQRAEEVTDEAAPVRLLAPGHRVMQGPNRISVADFAGWIEQRGSKFFSEWDPAYTAVVSTHDRDQAAQPGGWLWARYGDGHYTYFAYALHRQLPYGVPGAYRLLANLLSLGRQPR